MFATVGFTVALALTRGVTTLLHKRGAGPNGGLIVGGALIAPFALAVWHHLRGRPHPARTVRD